MDKNSINEMSKSEISIRKLLKNLGVTTHQLISKKIEQKLSNGEIKVQDNFEVNLNIHIKELDINKTISAKISTAIKDDQNS